MEKFSKNLHYTTHQVVLQMLFSIFPIGGIGYADEFAEQDIIPHNP
jgi:hypothetical protein